MDWLTENLWSAWLAAAVVLGVAEMFSLDLILIMLAVGAVSGMVLALLGAPFALQAVVAAGASVGMLALVRPSMAKKLHDGPTLTQGHDKLLGQQGTVTQAISGLQVGRVSLGGDVWTAAPYDETLTIAEGETVEVLQIRGATAYVHPVPRLEP
ncbi:NfeD family protein [Nocardioides sp.]|uniref:NfeD family protein n=1 Tax=Nocardioides sp. TaxID=35761 RepID=UPI002B272FB3|nr:NfeD family protein [Nocardioides sp.]